MFPDSLLASGSDDYQVCLWDPQRERLLHTIPTSHSGNIFSVKVSDMAGTGGDGLEMSV